MRKYTTDELGRHTPEEYHIAPKMPVVVVLDNIRSLYNVGSVFRTCDAFAVERLCLCGITATPPDREIHKTALGAETTVEWSYYKDPVKAIEALRGVGYRIIAVEQAEGSVPLGDFNCRDGERYALVLGNEVFGVSDRCMEMCDTAIEIPQSGTKHSLNVSVAAGVVLWNFYSAFRSRGLL
ncbi:MAG: RNA methyltransferase [Rikenellaceae bacterium]|nr:RNA methyltransferase [Rikenellaceae bacterium]